MKRVLRISLAVALIASIFVGGFAGSAAAAPSWADEVEQEAEQEIEQEAEAEVEQDQDVDQSNVNVQDDNFATSFGHGDATAVQASSQENNNAQVGTAIAANNAEQEAEQEVDD